MRLLTRIIGTVVIGSVIRRIILKRKGDTDGVEKIMMGLMPRMMDKIFGKLVPERRVEMLAHLRATLARLEEKYGIGNEPAAGAPPAAGSVAG